MYWGIQQVTMVYTDPPGTPGSETNNVLVNDLDLSIQKATNFI